MIKPFPLPVSLIGFAVAGLALGAGWKLGCFLGDLATGDRTIDWTPIKDAFCKRETQADTEATPQEAQATGVTET